MMRLIRVVAPHFVAGFTTDGTVKICAPIISYMRGWNDEKAREYIRNKGWKASVVETFTERGQDGNAAVC